MAGASTDSYRERERLDRLSVSDIFESIILTCSDTQLFTGAAYALTLRYWGGCTITAYHYDIVSNMMLLTTATHLMSVTMVRDYWKYQFLAIVRIVCITGVFVVTYVSAWESCASSSLDSCQPAA